MRLSPIGEGLTSIATPSISLPWSDDLFDTIWCHFKNLASMALVEKKAVASDEIESSQSVDTLAA